MKLGFLGRRGADPYGFYINFMVLRFAVCLRKFDCFFGSTKALPYRVSSKVIVLGSPIVYGILFVFMRTVEDACPYSFLKNVALRLTVSLPFAFTSKEWCPIIFLNLVGTGVLDCPHEILFADCCGMPQGGLLQATYAAGDHDFYFTRVAKRIEVMVTGVRGLSLASVLTAAISSISSKPKMTLPKAAY